MQQLDNDTPIPDRLHIGECLVVLSSREVHAPGVRRPARLTPKAVSVLLVLVRNAGNVVTRDELFAQVWPDTLPTNDVLTQAVTQLRKAFSAGAQDGSAYIETIAKSERVMTMSRSLTLTRSVLAEHIARATPAQLDFVESWFEAELASREQSKRARLLKAAGLPNAKTLDGYDWSNLRMPPDWGRAQLEALEFVDGREDLVLHGPVGTGKSHLAVAPGRLACMNAVPVRFFTASGLLMRLRRAKQENRLDRELAGIGKARLLIIDEFGYMPVDEEGSRLLFQVISDSYETRSIIHATNIESGGWGRVLGDKNMAAALIDRTVHHGRLIRFEGRSYRSEHALMTR